MRFSKVDLVMVWALKPCLEVGVLVIAMRATMQPCEGGYEGHVPLDGPMKGSCAGTYVHASPPPASHGLMEASHIPSQGVEPSAHPCTPRRSLESWSSHGVQMPNHMVMVVMKGCDGDDGDDHQNHHPPPHGHMVMIIMTIITTT